MTDYQRAEVILVPSHYIGYRKCMLYLWKVGLITWSEEGEALDPDETIPFKRLHECLQFLLEHIHHEELYEDDIHFMTGEEELWG